MFHLRMEVKNSEWFLFVWQTRFVWYLKGLCDSAFCRGFTRLFHRRLPYVVACAVNSSCAMGRGVFQPSAPFSVVDTRSLLRMERRASESRPPGKIRKIRHGQSKDKELDDSCTLQEKRNEREREATRGVHNTCVVVSTSRRIILSPHPGEACRRSRQKHALVDPLSKDVHGAHVEKDFEKTNTHTEYKSKKRSRRKARRHWSYIYGYQKQKS